MRIIVTIITVSFLSLFFCGCGHDGGSVVVSPSGGGTSNDPTRQAEDFLREIEFLNSLEGSPCLPETQGAEKIIQSGDRLNTWIKRKRVDETWKSEPEFLKVESITQKCVTNTETLVKLLHILQDKKPANENDNPPIKVSDTLVAECKEIVRCLSEIEVILSELDKEFGLSDLREWLLMVSRLRERFNAIESITNINANAIRAFAKSLEQDTEQLLGFAAHFNNFATSLKTEDLFIQTSDIYYLIQSIWLRNISNWARGDKQDVLERVKNLFDWTVCNIAVRDQNLVNNITLPLQLPWQSILLGNATNLDRAWVFIELLRQQRIDAVMLAIDDDSNVGELLFWGVGVLVNGEIYVFVPNYGIPLPAKDGLQFADDGTLTCNNIATFTQVLNDDSLLRRLDLSESNKFPVTSEKLKKSKMFLVASPETVSMRMKVLEADLSGDSSMILYTNLNEQRRMLSEMKSISDVKVAIWNHPIHAKFDQLYKYPIIGSYLEIFRSINPLAKQHNFSLWTGRILYFKGDITGQGGAMTHYQDARISDREIMELRSNPEVRKNKALLQVLQLTTNQAVFWIGTASFEINSNANAKDTMKELMQNSINIWQLSELYILGRIAEREKNYKDAINYYEQITKKTKQPSFAIRAKLIQEKTN
ncbi:MAG: hypothetical protein LBH59_01875 [Planctomycetaceae bacterium]|jgi:hypothetical protein|nr:hypothetical protein [Planctomycetaceae bacterium]